MSPITHGMIGWIISQPLDKRRDRIFVTIASLLPDFDGAGVVISIEYYSKYHHMFGHNIFFGILLYLVTLKFGIEKLKVSILVFVSFNFHILGDLLGSGSGWGIPYFWPINKKSFEFSHPFQWELDSWQNLLVTIICTFIIILFAINKKRTIVEVFSTKLDVKLIAVFENWFLRKK